MSKQDLNGVRTAQDLERKYDFASLLGLKKNIETQAKTLIKLDNELNSMLNTLIINLKDVLDSQSEVSLWFSSGIPTTSNYPYTTWATPSDHYGDIYYDRETGYVYQYSSSGWSRNEDYNLVQAMALTNAELGELSNYERKVFFTQPTPPYNSGDWWIQEDGTLYICQLGKVAGMQYEDGDFIVSSKYTTTVAVKQDNEIKVLKGTVLQITEDYVKYTDLSTGGSTTIAGENITTGCIKSANYVVNVAGMKIDLANGTIDTKNTKWDQYGNIALNNNAQIITDKGLLSNLQFISSFGQIGYSSNMQYDNKSYHNILAYIPEGFTIQSAYLTILSQPIKWSGGILSSAVWGYPRNLALYKDNNSKVQKEPGGDLSSATYDSLAQQTLSGGLFSNNSNTWTPSVPSDSSHNIQKIVSKDIKDKIAAGINHFIVTTTNSVPSSTADKYGGIGQGLAVLNVYGYIKIS